MANMVRMIRFSVGLGEMHSTYILLETIKRDNGLDDPYLEAMRIRLKKKLMEEEEGLITIAYERRETPKPRKYGMEGLGFSSPAESAVATAVTENPVDFNEDFMAKLNASLEAAKKGNNNGTNEENPTIS